MKRSYLERARLGNLVAISIREGVTIKPSKCSICECEGTIDGHHMDYSRPLDLIWICRSCHSKYHWGTNEESNNIRRSALEQWEGVIGVINELSQPMPI